MKTVIFWGVFGIFSLLFQGAKTAAGENDTSQEQTGQTGKESQENAGAPAPDDTSENPNEPLTFADIFRSPVLVPVPDDTSKNSNGRFKTFRELTDGIYRQKMAAIKRNEAVMRWGMFGGLGGSLVMILCDYPSAAGAALGLGVSIAGAGCYCAFKNMKEMGRMKLL